MSITHQQLRQEIGNLVLTMLEAMSPDDQQEAMQEIRGAMRDFLTADPEMSSPDLFVAEVFVDNLDFPPLTGDYELMLERARNAESPADLVLRLLPSNAE